MIWMLLVLFYGLAKGGREICKKKALEKNTVMEVLFFYTLLSFIFVIPDARNAGGLEINQYLLIALKSFVIFVAWICSFNAIKKMPVSIVGVIDLSRVLFATLMGVIFLGEIMSGMQVIGLVLVSMGLLMLPIPSIMIARKERVATSSLQTEGITNGKMHEEGIVNGRMQKENVKPLFVILTLISCILNAVSGTMDKYLMSTDMTSGQLQFWYMLFLVGYYGIYLLVRRIKLNWKSLFRNYWLWILAILFVLADRALFIANGYEESKVTIMTLIKQSGCIITILGGKFVFKEKNIWFKFICAGIIIAGIVVAVI